MPTYDLPIVGTCSAYLEVQNVNKMKIIIMTSKFKDGIVVKDEIPRSNNKLWLSSKKLPITPNK